MAKAAKKARTSASGAVASSSAASRSSSSSSSSSRPRRVAAQAVKYAEDDWDVAELDSDQEEEQEQKRAGMPRKRGAGKKERKISRKRERSVEPLPAPVVQQRKRKPKQAKKPKQTGAALSAHEVRELSVNDCFARKGPAPTINLWDGKATRVPDDWNSRTGARAAASFDLKQVYVGRLLGTITVHALHVEPDVLEYLTQEVEPFVGLRPNRYSVQRQVAWDDDGNFPTRAKNEIALSTVVNMVDMPGVSEIDEELGELVWREEYAPKLLADVYCLQHPTASPWESPLISTRTNHWYDARKQELKLTIFIYASRLLFEMIADPAIHTMMQHVEPIAATVPCAQLEPQPEMFTVSGAEQLETNRAYRFSLAGVLKRAESRGYAYSVDTPDALAVELFDYQKSTLQWMLDHERDPRGLNSYFWEERQWGDEGVFFYFPLAGELRLDPPPLTTGGLLSEEMGLGKTVELLSLILCNPSSIPPGTLATVPTGKGRQQKEEQLQHSKATLIVVPPSLLSQWENEITTRVRPGHLSVLRLSLDSFQQPIVDTVYDEEGNEITDDQWMFLRSGTVAGMRIPNGQPNRIYYGKLAFDRAKRILTGENDAAELKARCTLTQINFQLEDHDIVLTDYSTFKSRAAMFRKFVWHRVVLDECQEIKVATNVLAAQCSNLEATHRWMVSGTPLCTKIEDLHGELNFLKVWPFSLQNDGFWEKKIGTPFMSRDESGLELLEHLIDVVMIRHSKSQTYIDGRPLIQIPKRRIEYRPVLLTDPAEQYVYGYLEVFAREALTAAIGQDDNGAAVVRIGNAVLQPRDLVKLRAVAYTAMRALISGHLIVLGTLDTQRRLLLRGAAAPRVFGHGRHGDDRKAEEEEEEEFRRMPPEDILRFVQSAGAGVLALVTAGLNRDTDRVFALANKREEEARERLGGMSIAALRQLVIDYELPVPMTWITMPFKVSVCTGDSTVQAHVEPSEDPDKPSKTPADCIKAGDVLRLGKYSVEEAEVTVENATEASIAIAHPWELEDQNKVAIFRHAQSTRKQAYVDLLVARELNFEGTGELGGSQVHEGGFAALYRLIARQGVTCPVCMSEAERPIVTPCVHIYCHSCMNDVLGTPSPRCPICRRAIDRRQLMEADTAGFTEALQDHQSQRAELMELGDGAGEVKQVEDEDAEKGERGARPAARAGWAQVPGKGKRRRLDDRNAFDLETSSSYGSGDEEADSDDSYGRTTAPSAASTRTRATSPASASDSQNSALSPTAPSNGTGDIEFDVPELRVTESITEEILRTFAPPLQLVNRDQHYPSLDHIFLSHLAIYKARLPSKLRAMFADIRQSLEEDATTKFVIFSQFAESLHAFPQQWRQHKVATDPELDFAILHGPKRDADMNRFLKDPACNVCLIPLGSGASGLTLTVARVCYFLEPVQSAAVEAQAVNRIHRISQTKDVRCVTFFARNSIEERLLAFRKEQKMLTELLANPDALSVQTELNPQFRRAAPAGGRRRGRGGRGGFLVPELDDVDAEEMGAAQGQAKQGIFSIEGLQTLFLGRA